MQELPKLNFPPAGLRLREGARGREVWAVTRRQWLVLTPEEWVRRNLVAYLTTCCGVDLNNAVFAARSIALDSVGDSGLDLLDEVICVDTFFLFKEH